MSETRRSASWRAWILGIAVACPITAAAAVLGFWYIMDTPGGSRDGEAVQIIVPRGTTFREAARSLEDAGLAPSALYLEWRYRIAAKIGRAAPLQAGRYALNPGRKPSELIAALTSSSGAHRLYTTLTIPPGSTASRIAALVERSGLARAEDVQRSILSLASEYPVAENDEGLQGYLFPDTYKVETPLDDTAESSRAAADAAVRMMADRFFEVLGEIDGTWSRLTRVQLHEKVILASIVEREYRVALEAPVISAVFNNRLEQSIPLQSCATVVYAIEETEAGKPFQDDYHRFNRRIFEQYLRIQSDYNTYYQPRLPPGPIASPGRTALEAAFFPAESSALFFVVKDPAAGTHTFTTNFSDHEEARISYLNQYVVKD